MKKIGCSIGLKRERWSKKIEDAIYGQPLFTIADGFLGSLNPRVFVPTAANVPCQDKIDGKQILNMHSRADGNRHPHPTQILAVPKAKHSPLKLRLFKNRELD